MMFLCVVGGTRAVENGEREYVGLGCAGGDGIVNKSEEIKMNLI